MTQTIAYLNYNAGVCGEALLAALVHVGMAPDILNTMLTTFPVKDGQCIVELVKSQGRSGYRLRFEYILPEQPLYSFDQAAKLLETTSLTEHVRTTTLRILRSVFEAEATIQEKPVEALQLPAAYVMELLLYGAGIVMGLQALRVVQLYAPPLPLPTMEVAPLPPNCGSPSQVALEIFRRASIPLKPGVDAVAPITPACAAIVATLARFDAPVMTIERAGYGFCDYHETSYSQGIYLGKAHVSPYVTSNEAETDWIASIETHIDTMSGELLGDLMERLLAAGALDVSYTSIQMKKNRPATKITVICPPDEGERLSLLLLRETNTLGVRIQHIQRLKAQRFQQRVDTPLGSAVVKVKRLGNRIVSVAPEYEECRRIAQERQLSLADVYAIVHETARKTIIGQEE